MDKAYPYGYSVDADNIRFEAKWEDSQTGIDDRTGQRVPIDYEPSRRLAVAGDFNGWTLDYMAQNPRVFSDWGLYTAKANFPAGKSQFKFVYDDHIWIDPPASAPNAVKSDVGYDSSNLVIEIEAIAVEAPKKKRTKKAA